MNLDVVFANAVRRFGDRPAVSDADRTLSFNQLEQRTARLANALLAVGVRHQDRIASLQYNSIETLEFDVAAARFGFVRTLLNARADIADFEYVLNHCRAKTLVFGTSFADKVAAMRDRLRTVEHYICVGDPPSWATAYEDLIGRAPELPPQYEVTESDWHSIYYTSGTTGQPKGVVLSQRNWLVLLRNHLVDPFRYTGPSDILMHAAPMSHASGAFIFAHLARGARQVLVPRFDATAVLEQIDRERVTTTFLAPTMIVMLMEHKDHDRFDLSSLRTVVYGGAPMAVEHVKEALRRWGPVLAQGYGQWEAPQLFTYLDQEQHRLAVENGKEHRLASTGLPMTFCRVAVADDRGNLLPAGAEGEVCTSGDHLMVGYLDNPEATKAERFGAWQRTGDIGRMDEDGFVYLTDRKKDLIITGGSNVYPREIEEVLHRHPDVLEAIALGIPDDKWGERVHALIVPRRGRSVDGESFLAWCRDRLGADKRPRSVEQVSELPKSAYGKILRRELRQRYWQGRDRRI